MKARTGKALAHIHRDYAESFVVEAGEATAKVDGRTVRLSPGETLTVEADESHVNPYNAGGADLVMRHIFEPLSDFAAGYVERLGYVMRAGRADRQGELPVSAAFAIAHATDSQTFAKGVPPAVQRGLLAPVGARIARLRGVQLYLPV